MVLPVPAPRHPNVIATRLRRRRNEGFSLIELSVVLVLLTIVLGLGLGALNAQLQSGNATVTRQRMETIRQALIAHLGAAKRLPCAADPSSLTGPDAGKEACASAYATFGVVPYTALGLSRETAEDGWGNLFSYAVFAEATPVCPTPGGGPGKDWKNAACFGEGKTGGFIVKDGTVGAATDLTANAIAVIVSHGANGLGAWTRETTRNASPVRCEEAHNSSQSVAGCALAASTFYRGERADVDDMVGYLNAGEAIQQLARQGVVKTAPARMADDMQSALELALGAVVANGCGSQSITLPAAVDPWGNPYTPIGAFVTPSANSIFQITSPGCTTCSPAVPSATRQITKTELNAKLVNAGLSPCP